MTEFVIYVLAVVDVAAVLLAALTICVFYLIKGGRDAYRALRRRRARRKVARRARLDQDPTVILRRLDAEFPHITPRYVRELSDFYLIPGEDFR